MEPREFLGEKIDEIKEQATFDERQYFKCPHCDTEMVTLAGVTKEAYIANVAAYAYLLDKTIDVVFPPAGIILDDDENVLSESVLEAADEYVRNDSDFNFDPETMVCNCCNTNIKTGIHEDLKRYVK